MQRRVRRRIRENQRSHSSLYHSSSSFEVVQLFGTIRTPCLICRYRLSRVNCIKVDGQGVLVVESDASHFTYGRISILVGSGNLVGIVLRSTGDKLYY
jgi:hypothetical protein